MQSSRTLPTEQNISTQTAPLIVSTSVLYVHGRRVLIILTIILLVIAVIGVLYYNGKVVYETGL